MENPGVEKMCDPPTQPGWYLARMKYRATYTGREIVKVSIGASGLEVWQPADERAWRIGDFEWFARLNPNLL